MARRYGQTLVSIWNDEEWWELTDLQQRLYMLLISQPDMTYCGVVPLRPTKWAKLSSDGTTRKVAAALKVLEQKDYIKVDERHEEVWVRTFVKHNKVIEQDQLLKSLKASYENIASPTIKMLVWNTVPEGKRAGMTPPKGTPGPQGGGSLPGSPNGASPPGPVIGVTNGSSDLDLDLDLELDLETQSLTSPVTPPEPVTPPAADVEPNTEPPLPPGSSQRDVEAQKTLERRSFRFHDLALDRMPQLEPQALGVGRVMLAACRVLADELIEECIGYLAQLKNPPNTAKYLAITMANWGTQRNIPGAESIAAACGPLVKRAS